MYLYHSILEVGASDHSSDPLHDIEEEAQEEEVGDIHPLAFLLASHYLVLGLSTHLWIFVCFETGMKIPHLPLKSPLPLKSGLPLTLGRVAFPWWKYTPGVGLQDHGWSQEGTLSP